MKKEKKQRKGETPKPYRGHQSYVNYLGRFVGVFEDVINKAIKNNDVPVSCVIIKNKHNRFRCQYTNLHTVQKTFPK